ncbi:MAG: hypothetical protein ACK500_08850 [Flavobacteriales bacterium]
MTHIDQILNQDFLIRLVSIQSIKAIASADTSMLSTGPSSDVEMRVMAIEPGEAESTLSENIYNLRFSQVTRIQIDLSSILERTFEFDTDEVTLVRHEEHVCAYTISFRNSHADIHITFSEIAMLLLSKRAIYDGKMDN